MIDLDTQCRMKAAGYDVHTRSSHVGIRYDYTAPWKGQMNSRIIETPSLAWEEAYAEYISDLEKAQRLVKASK